MRILNEDETCESKGGSRADVLTCDIPVLRTDPDISHEVKRKVLIFVTVTS